MVPIIWKRAVILWAVLLAACAIQLVPDYDQALVEGLDEANTAAQTLFAAVESGSPQSEFADYEERYADLIGRFEALRQRALNRQIPPLAARLSRLRVVETYCNSERDPTGCINVSPASLTEVLRVIREMRERHKLHDATHDGLRADVVGLFRTDYNTAIQQAITVENALKR